MYHTKDIGRDELSTKAASLAGSLIKLWAIGFSICMVSALLVCLWILPLIVVHVTK